MSSNPVTRATFVARRSIPEAIITQVFGQPASPYARAVPNIDEEIARLVIRPRVIVDCDILGGQEITVRVAECEVERTADNLTVITVPKTLTQGKSITSWLSLSLMDTLSAAASYGGANFNACSVTSLGTAALAVANSYSNMNRMHTGRLEPIGENTVLVHDSNLISSFGTLKVIVANDQDMNNLPYRFYIHFTRLCTLAVEAYVFWKLDVDLDEGKVKSGFNIGAFRRKIDSYADSEQKYQDYLDEKWQKVAIIADRASYLALARSTLRSNF